MNTPYKDQVVWIIGASSGIGEQLARVLSARGAVLALSARRKDALDAINTALGGRHRVFALDVCDAEIVMRTAQAIRATFGRIDRVIFMAAAYAPMRTDALDIAVTKGIIEINLMGAFNVVNAVIPTLKSQKSPGQIALCGSVAGYIGLPGGQPYSATKAAIANLAESLNAECGHVIDIKLISPGFVRTPMTDKNSFKMPLIIGPDQAAREIADGLLKRRFEIHFPRKFTILMKTLRLLPYPLSFNLLRSLKVKGQ